MTWIDLLGPVVLALILLTLPGLAIAYSAALRGFDAFALSPALSITSIGVGAFLGGVLGIPWGWWTPAVTALVIAVIAFAVVKFVRRRWQVEPPPRTTFAADAPAWIGLAIAAALMARHLRNVLDRPDAFSQTYDNIFHLSAIRYIHATRLASPFEIGHMTAADDQAISFYPTAFHNTASLVMDAFPTTVTLPTNAVLAIVVALVWPASCLLLVRWALPKPWPALLSAGVLCTVFPAFPLLLLTFGVLYPNLFGLAVLPALLALLVRGLGLSAYGPVERWRAFALLLAALPGLLLAHPNTAMTLLAVALPAVVWVASRRFVLAATRRDDKPWWPTALGLTIFLGVVWVLWVNVRPPVEAATWPPLTGVPSALGQAILNAPDDARAAWLGSALMVAGLAVALRGSAPWLALAWATLTGLWLVVAGWPPSDLRTFFTGIWYNDPWRFAATLPLAAVPLAALGAAHLSSMAVEAVAPRLHGRAAGWSPAIVFTVMVIGLAGATQRAPYMDEAVNYASSQYQLNADSPLVTADEYAVIRKAAEIVPQGTVVATNPWNGSSMAWALAGIETTNTHVLYTPGRDATIIKESLDEASEDPTVCAAADRLNVGYALDFGEREVHGGRHPYPGLESLDDAPGFRVVARQGEATLYEMTACD